MPQPLPSEPVRHEQIDAMLRAAGWDVRDRATLNLAAAPSLAILQFQDRACPAFLRCVGDLPLGVVEAKNARPTLSSVEAQSRETYFTAERAEDCGSSAQYQVGWICVWGSA